MIDEAGITVAKESREQRIHMGQIYIHRDTDTQAVFWLLYSVIVEEKMATSWVFRMEHGLQCNENVECCDEEGWGNRSVEKTA
jgi:hypothetical protein